jgi:hypothetical protein
MSETEGLPTEEFPGEPEPETEEQGDEVPEGVYPETGEVTDQPEPDADDAEALAENERRAELAAERQAEEQAQAESEAEIERQGKALDRATKAYVDKLRAALGDDLGEWHACPMCADGFPGIRMAVMPQAEQLAAIKVEIGEDPDPDLAGDPYSRRCDHCDGYGKVSTGSRISGQKSAQCYDCKGRGWVAVGSERESGQITVGNGNTTTPAPVLQDNPSHDPPEVRMLQELGYIVVAPIAATDVPAT